jgi:hypothetical protein
LKRIRVVLCVVSIMAMMAMSVGPAAAGSNPNSVLEPSLTGSKPTSALDPGLAGSKRTGMLDPGLTAQEPQSEDVDKTFEVASSADRWL